MLFQGSKLSIGAEFWSDFSFCICFLFERSMWVCVEGLLQFCYVVELLENDESPGYGRFVMGTGS